MSLTAEQIARIIIEEARRKLPNNISIQQDKNINPVNTWNCHRTVELIKQSSPLSKNEKRELWQMTNFIGHYYGTDAVTIKFLSDIRRHLVNKIVYNR